MPSRYLPRSWACSTSPPRSRVVTSRKAVLLWTPSCSAIVVTPTSPDRASMSRIARARSTDCTPDADSAVLLLIAQC